MRSLGRFAAIASPSAVYLAFVLWFLQTRADPKFGDWANHRWFVEQQARSWAENLHPSWFVHSVDTGIFYPVFAFYGGTLYGGMGLVAWLIGVDHAYSAGWLLGLLVSSASGIMIARWCGLGIVAQAAIGLATGSYPYLVTNGFARFAFTEYVALACLALFSAGVVGEVVQTSRITLARALIVLGAIGVSGSHNITTVWAIAVGGVVLLVWLIVASGPRFIRRIATVLALTSIGIFANSWFLLPAFLNRDSIQIGNVSSLIFYSLGNNHLVDPGLVYSIIPKQFPNSGTPNLNTNLPTPLLVLSLTVVVLLVFVSLWRSRLAGPSHAFRRFRYVLLPLVPLIVLLACVHSTRLQLALPEILASAQMTYRLLGPASLLVILLCVVAGRSLPHRLRMPFSIALLLAALVQAGFAVHNVSRAHASDAPPWTVLNTGVFAPASMYSLADYRLTPSESGQRMVEACDFLTSPRVAQMSESLYLYPATSDEDLCETTLIQGKQYKVLRTNLIASSFTAVRSPALEIGQDGEGFVVVGIPTTMPDRFTVEREMSLVNLIAVFGTVLAGLVILALCLTCVKRAVSGRRRQ